MVERFSENVRNQRMVELGPFLAWHSNPMWAIALKEMLQQFFEDWLDVQLLKLGSS